jgi:hypothetical protein
MLFLYPDAAFAKMLTHTILKTPLDYFLLLTDSLAGNFQKLPIYFSKSQVQISLTPVSPQ